jgi:hypothetical protein
MCQIWQSMFHFKERSSNKVFLDLASVPRPWMGGGVTLKYRKPSRIFGTLLIDPCQGGVEELLGGFDVLDPGSELLRNLEPRGIVSLRR